MKAIDKDTAKQYIYKTNGKIFSAVFRKKDGEKRKIVCRLRVKKYVKGVGLNHDPEKLGYIIVYDMVYARTIDPKRAYRHLNAKTLEQLKVKGIEYKIIGDSNEK